MKKYWIGTQVFLGEAERARFSLDHISEAVRRAREIAGLDGLMIAAGGDAELTSRIASAARACGVEAYLWFSVLADVPGLKTRDEDLMILPDGTRGNGKSGAWEGLVAGDEEFSFSCPNNAPAMERVFAAYTRLLDRVAVEGVMLDRVRFPSPVNGFEALFTCFCAGCAGRYERETGRLLETERRRTLGFLSRLPDLTAEAFRAETRVTDTLWTVAGLTSLAEHRRRSVTEAVRRFTDHARSRGLKVGLDLFSPSLAGLVGQDYQGLSALADWVKPMLYCHAVGPAGLPLELASLGRGLAALSPRLGESGACSLLGELLGWKVPGSFGELLQRGLPESLIAQELGRIGALDLSGARVHAGIEAVRIPHYRVDITAETLRKSLSFLGTPASGVIASWDLLHIPEENLRLIGALNA